MIATANNLGSINKHFHATQGPAFARRTARRMAYDDEDYYLPLEDQRVFGAGIKRKRVPFIQAGVTNLDTTSNSVSAPATTSSSPAPSHGPSIGDKYLSIVLGSSSSDRRSSSSPPDGSGAEPTPPTITCDVCNLPLPAPGGEDDDGQGRRRTHLHEASLAHQVCLPYSEPPSAVDRRRLGYKYLSSYGWDADARMGLGATGQGIQVPLKPKPKYDTAGLGVKLAEGRAVSKRKPEPKLDAKQVRKLEMDKKRKGEKLSAMFYRNESLEKYLGE
jgi:hypothetical protein